MLELSPLQTLFRKRAKFAATLPAGITTSSRSSSVNVDVGGGGRWLAGRVAGDPSSEVRLTAVYDLFYGAV